MMNQLEDLRKSLDDMQDKVAEWSFHNFKNQNSKLSGSLVLGPVAPVLGMMEEIGEAFESCMDRDGATPGENEIDAYGDFMIFSLDWHSRMNGIEWFPSFKISQSLNELSFVTNATSMSLVSCMGRFCHANLKTHQGIRGFDNLEVASATLRSHWLELASSLHALIFNCELNSKIGYQTFLTTTEKVTREVFERVVMKRDWTSNKVTG